MLKTLSDEVTARIIKTHGKVTLHCSPATGHVVAAAKKAGIELRRAVGFFGLSQHHWAVAEDGTIVDPTGAQFNGGWNGIVTVDNRRYRYYEEIDSDAIDLVARYGSSMQYDVWQGLKKRKLIKEPLVIHQEAVQEMRTNHLGLPYFFERFDRVEWPGRGVGDQPCSVTVMTCKDPRKLDVLVHWKTRFESGKVRHWHQKIIAIKFGGSDEYPWFMFIAKGSDGKINRDITRNIHFLVTDTTVRASVRLNNKESK